MARLRESQDKFKPGDHWVIDDRTGLQIRSSKARKEWTGLIVDGDEEWETRHPQDFVRAKADRQQVRNPRPDPEPVFVGPPETTVTTAALAGETSIEVVSSSEFITGNEVSVFLENGESHRATLTSVPDSTHIAFTGHPLPWSVAAEAQVVNWSRTPTPGNDL